MQRRILPAVFLLAMPFLAGFDLSRSNIPVEDILSGGPPKDGIPALLAPKFVPADQASYLQPRDRVIGFVRKDVAKAYSLRVLNWHEVVNDSVGSTAIAVTYCPLTGSGVVLDRRARRTPNLWPRPEPPKEAATSPSRDMPQTGLMSSGWEEVWMAVTRRACS